MEYFLYGLVFLSLLGSAVFLYMVATDVYDGGIQIVTWGKLLACILIVLVPFVATLLFIIGFSLVALEHFPQNWPRLYIWLQKPVFPRNPRRVRR